MEPQLLPENSTPSTQLTAGLEKEWISPVRKQPHVIVVGGGISGLRAASVLQRHGVKVTVLEGHPDRLGGRISTSRRQGKAARDIGAAWMHETSQNKLVQLIPKLGIEYYYDDDIPSYYTRDGPVGTQFRAKHVADEFADHIKWFYAENPAAPDRSVKDSVEEYVQNHPLITPSEKLWAPQAARQVELWIGTSIEEASSKHLSYFMKKRNLHMKGGYEKIVNWIAEPLLQDPKTIWMGQVVRSISWDSSSVGVKCDKLEFKADAVVVTVSLGCLRNNQISFNPPLPTLIQAGISAFSYGALGKVFVEFDNVFWPKENDQFVYYPSPPSASCPFDPDSILSYATITSNLWIMSGVRALCVQISEPLTQRMEVLPSAAVYEFFEPLFKLLQTDPHTKLPNHLDIETTHWTTDYLAGFGSYSTEKVGDESQLLVEALEMNKGARLQFAGEHCIQTSNGCVNGAFETGEVAARNLLEGVLGISWDQKDTTTRSISQ